MNVEEILENFDQLEDESICHDNPVNRQKNREVIAHVEA